MSHSGSACVFLVDDDEDDCFLIQEVFKQYCPECKLRVLTNGQDLVDALASAEALPTLILLDINMPLMNGLEALRVIRQNVSYDDIAIVMLTTSSQPADHRRAMELRANSYHTKPPTIMALNKLVLQLRQDWLEGRCIGPGCCRP